MICDGRRESLEGRCAEDSREGLEAKGGEDVIRLEVFRGVSKGYETRRYLGYVSINESCISTWMSIAVERRRLSYDASNVLRFFFFFFLIRVYFSVKK
jgi:hypothetical protein